MITTEIIVRKSKPNYFSIASGLILFYFAYNYYDKGNMPFAIIAVAAGITSLFHTILLLTTPLLVHQNDSLVVKPKIPFEKKVLLVEEIKEVKANSESQLIIIMDDKTKIKLDLGGFKKKEIEVAKAYLLGLIK